MKWVTWVLLFALASLQYSLWMGHGSWHDMLKLERSVIAQNASNENLIQRNRALIAEVKDLAKGKDAINEMARAKLGYIQDGEVFYRFVPSGTSATITANSDTTPNR
ncbi:cell division protein FtsB [Snodgrassella communis]|uniref:cell division protein FtsB n=1 Tax=Snodgrassella communis TaxID=2946699 RepID=UPI001EF64C91|nr:cell division protein FtsB [Snodgrassella communis]WMY91365.1 cell division protein FtsB [Snodgrassella communis]